MNNNQVSNWLSRFFILHFIIDLTLAIPLFFWPEPFLKFIGWQTVDPVMTRLVAAALFGIGIESLIGRNSSKEVFRAMLNLKIIWSFAAITGLLLSLGQVSSNLIIWLILIIFVAFNILWIYWRVKLN